ncbi:MAG: C4-dicarboxylate ABC transporter, partial [Candidatus Dadabacteria bacterium]
MAVTAAMAALVASPGWAKEKRVLLKVPIAFSTALPALGTTIQW